MSYVILFYGKSADTRNVFYIQKCITIIIAHTQRKISGKQIFRKVNILPPASEYLPLYHLLWTIRKSNSTIQNTNTRPSCAEYYPHYMAKGKYYTRTELLNHLSLTKACIMKHTYLSQCGTCYLLAQSLYSVWMSQYILASTLFRLKARSKSLAQECTVSPSASRMSLYIKNGA
jgi:hypothetical protein